MADNDPREEIKQLRARLAELEARQESPFNRALQSASRRGRIEVGRPPTQREPQSITEALRWHRGGSPEEQETTR